jgi:hypothetical protein
MRGSASPKMPEAGDGLDHEQYHRFVEDAKPFVRVIELDSIRTLRAEVELLDTYAADNLDLEKAVTTATGQVSVGDTELHYRVNHEAVFVDGEGTDGVRVAVDLEVGFIIPADFTPTPEQIQGCAMTLVPRIVHPFYREAVSSLLTRVGVGEVTVGLVKFPPSSSETESGEETRKQPRKKSSAKKSPAKKSTAKSTAAKKSPAKSTATKKSTVKKSTAAKRSTATRK